ncbi:hypothetical protein Tco_0312471 [Tanacetum coccineum]
MKIFCSDRDELARIKIFKDVYIAYEVIDINSFSLHYTWNQKPKGRNGILKKLDRIMGNIDFVDRFPGAYALFQPYRISDHSSSVLKLPLCSVSKPKPFKFYNFLTHKSRFLEVVATKWSSEEKIDEERFLKQKAKIDWLADEVTRTFVSEVFVAHYEAFLGTSTVCDDLDTTSLFLKTELMHNYQRNRGPSRCAFKVDIQKVYDTVTGLVPSIPKSTTFFCNVMNHVKISILNVMPFSKGELPVKYLGVPFISPRLLNKDCKVLVEKARNLYWASVLAIPFGITEDIQQLIWGFYGVMANIKEGKQRDIARRGHHLHFSSKVWLLIRKLDGMDSVAPILEDIITWFLPIAAKRTFNSVVGEAKISHASIQEQAASCQYALGMEDA